MYIRFIANIDWTKVIDWILRILQILTFLGLMIKIGFKNEEYINNVEIKSLSPMQFDPLHNHFHFIYEYNHRSNLDSMNHYLFYPKGVDIKKIDFFSLSYDMKKYKKYNEKGFSEKKIYSIKNIKNKTCLLIHTNLPEIIPNLRMRWMTSSGEIGEYTFQTNGYNGYTDISEYKYRLTWKRKIFQVFS